MGRIIRRMLERPKPRRTRIEHFEKIQKVLHKIYLNIPEEEGQGQIEILWGKAINNANKHERIVPVPFCGSPSASKIIH